MVSCVVSVGNPYIKYACTMIPASVNARVTRATCATDRAWPAPSAGWENNAVIGTGAGILTDGAKPTKENAFKLTLVERTLAAVLAEAEG